MHLVRKDTDYGAFREIFKDGNKIIGWIEQRPNGDFYYAYGKPTQKEPYMIYICETLDEAERRIIAG